MRASQAGIAGTATSQAPEGGWARRLLGRFHFTGVFWYRVHLWGVRNLPDRAVAPAIWLFAGLFSLALRRIRRAIAGNLEAVLGPCGWWQRQCRVFRTLHEFSWCLTERYERLSGKHQATATGEGLDHWHELLARPGGFVLVTAHVGLWETGPETATRTGGRHVHVVREEEMDPQAQDFLRELIRQQAGDAYSVHFAAGDPRLGAHLLAALRRGELAALQGDRPRNGGRAVTATLFGRPFDLPMGPLALARAAGVPLLPVFCFRQGRLRTHQIVRPPIFPAHTPDRTADLREAAERLARDVEWAIRQQPHQWFCFRELWPVRRRPSE